MNNRTLIHYFLKNVSWRQWVLVILLSAFMVLPLSTGLPGLIAYILAGLITAWSAALAVVDKITEEFPNIPWEGLDTVITAWAAIWFGMIWPMTYPLAVLCVSIGALYTHRPRSFFLHTALVNEHNRRASQIIKE